MSLLPDGKIIRIHGKPMRVRAGGIQDLGCDDCSLVRHPTLCAAAPECVGFLDAIVFQWITEQEAKDAGV